MGKYREKMTHDMIIRGFSPKTQQAYLDRMKQFVKFFMTPPDQLGLKQIYRYQVHLAEKRQLSYSYFNQSVCALRFFYTVTLNRGWNIKHIPYQKKQKTLPTVLSKEEVQAFFGALQPHIKYYTIAQTIYATGLRISEALNLAIPDIDNKRMVLKVRQGKGKKDRYLMLSPKLLLQLRCYWKALPAKPPFYLFPGRWLEKPLHPNNVRREFRRATSRAGLRKPVTPHVMRHTFATHMLEDGANVRKIQVLLGHGSLNTTQKYTHVAQNFINETISPLDTLSDYQDPGKEE